MTVALLMRIVTRDWTNVGVNPAFRKNALWYIVSVLAYPLIMVVSLIIGVMLSIASVSNFSMMVYLQTALPALAIFFIFALFEEFGWRGYLAPKLASLGINSYVASALLAIVWTAWHIPYLRDLLWVYNSESLLSFIPRYYLLLFAISIVYNEIRTITGTFWPAVLMHAISNSFGHPLTADYVTVEADKDYLGSVSTGLFVIAFTFLWAIAINYWRMRKASRQEPSAHGASIPPREDV